MHLCPKRLQLSNSSLSNCSVVNFLIASTSSSIGFHVLLKISHGLDNLRKTYDRKQVKTSVRRQSPRRTDTEEQGEYCRRL